MADLRLDHFLFYDTLAQEAGHKVALKGQFDEEPERVKLTYLDLFGNPVIKNRGTIHDRNAHLTWYNLFDPVPDPVRVVKFRNQFGEQKVLIGKSIALLAPARKYEKGSAFPKRLDHFKVYRVLGGEPVDKEVTLKDQFESGRVKVRWPAAFAVPVWKYHHGNTFKIQNEKAHLALYAVTPWYVRTERVVRDQFGRHLLRFYRSVMLAVPSEKQDWAVEGEE